jgi:hypothetical protein
MQIKLLIDNKPIICAFETLHYQISREKFEPGPGLKLGPAVCSMTLPSVDHLAN